MAPDGKESVSSAEDEVARIQRLWDSCKIKEPCEGPPLLPQPHPSFTAPLPSSLRDLEKSAPDRAADRAAMADRKRELHERNLSAFRDFALASTGAGFMPSRGFVGVHTSSRDEMQVGSFLLNSLDLPFRNELISRDEFRLLIDRAFATELAVPLPVPSEDSPTSIIRVSADVGARLLARYRADPAGMRTMPRRLFEELVAEIWRSFDYEVELTQQSWDGGIDVIAIRHAEVHTRYLIQCKRPDPGNSVDVAPVRQLLGVVTSERATKGIIATTTRFTAPATALLEKEKWELEGRDYFGLVDWLGRAFAAKLPQEIPPAL